jgi:hypothetical protein
LVRFSGIDTTSVAKDAASFEFVELDSVAFYGSTDNDPAHVRSIQGATRFNWPETLLIDGMWVAIAEYQHNDSEETVT